MDLPRDIVADDADTQQLAQSVAKSDKFIADIKATIHKELHDQKQATASWRREIDQLERKRELPKVIIGVVGATGSGKSSIINAILGEKQLVPTNCMRACTAVVTEISFNSSTEANYRAVIEFVSLEEWKQELELLLGDLLTGGKLTGDINDDDSEAGIAFAKVQAVYPHLNKSNLPKATITELLHFDCIKDLLGTEIEFNTSTAKELHANIQRYVDSTEKLAEDFALHGLQASSSLDDIAYWPLIRNVRIYTKAPVLETGSVLVDLPGVADSNAARSAIAQKYLQNCSALWIVAPIIRAVDDKTARHLLGEGFKRQLWRDGTLQRMTFICSKTDEISISEARAALERYPMVREKFTAIDRDRASIVDHKHALQQSAVELRRNIELTTQAHKEALQEEKEYKILQAHAKSGESVYPLVRVEVKKRKQDGEALDLTSTPPKKTKYEVQLAAAFDTPSKRRPVSAQLDTQVSQIEFRQDHTKARLNALNVKTKLESLKSKKRDLKSKKKALKLQEQELKDDILMSKARVMEISASEWISCVLGRNEVSSCAIRIDFAAGLRDIARDENDDTPEEDCTIGEETSSDATVRTGPDSLPVFCVSAKGYYKTSGLMEEEKISACFDNLADTGIPTLCDHVYKLGNDTRVAAQQVYVDGAQRLLTSLRLWACGQTIHVQAEVGVPGGDEEFCLRLIEGFIKDIKLTANTAMDTIVETVDHGLLAVLPNASRSASQAAPVTALRWTASRKSDSPGLHYQTFKAVIRRVGLFAALHRTHDFNNDLLKPYMQSIDNHWNDVFNIRIDKIFRKALDAGAGQLDRFVELFGNRLGPASKDGSQATVRRTFDNQMKLFTRSLGTLFRDSRKSIESHQKEVNRIFELSVKKRMGAIYATLEQETGTGAYDRCREQMKAYLDENKDAMFDRASRKVKEKFQVILQEVRLSLLTDLETSCDSLQRDCRYLCQKGRDFSALPETARDAIIRVLEDAGAGKSEDGSIAEVAVTIDPELLATQYDMPDALQMGQEHTLPLRSMTPALAILTDEEIWDTKTDEKIEFDSDSDSDSDSEDGEDA